MSYGNTIRLKNFSTMKKISVSFPDDWSNWEARSSVRNLNKRSKNVKKTENLYLSVISVRNLNKRSNDSNTLML